MTDTTNVTNLQLVSEWVTVGIQVQHQGLLLCDGAGLSGRATHTQTILHLYTFPCTESWCEALNGTKTFLQPKAIPGTFPAHLARRTFQHEADYNTSKCLCTWQVSIDLTICAFWQESMEPARLRITQTADSSINSDTCGEAVSRFGLAQSFSAQ